ncbi:MAG: hypothetical protein AMJ77_03170 [Dehalococcoidia bacterium SM23_28_2]|nr:MAG: hypothetical protein AMJ77_03170 [Dehalococcoidia bacterium SM23_28_2]
MSQDVEALHQLGRLAIEGGAAKETLALAASIIRRGTRAAEVIVVYAEDQHFLACGDAEDSASTDFTSVALAIVQSHIFDLGGPVAFDLIGHRVEEFTSASSGDDRQFLALAVPTSQSPSEMCVLRGPCKHEARASMLRFMESAMPALTIIMERFLNADRNRRQGEQLHAFADAAQVLSRSDNVEAALLEAALTNLATAIAAPTGADIINIDVYDAKTDRFFLRILSESRFSGTSPGQVWRNSFNPERPEPYKLEMMRTRQPVFLPDAQNDERAEPAVRQFFRMSLIRSVAIFPMLFQDEFLGTIGFVYFKPRPFHPEEVKFLQGFAAQAASALKAAQMHKALRESEERFSQVAQSSREWIWEVDSEGRYTYSSPAVKDILGYEPEEVIGKYPHDFYAPEDKKQLAARDRESFTRKGTFFQAMARQVHKDGHTVVVESAGLPILDGQGNVLGYRGVYQDITERRRAEEERERLYAELQIRAITDGLTGLYNHAHFYQRLGEEIERSRRYKHGFAVVMMDVDNFKQYNDSRGHQAGDGILRLLADCIRKAIRGSDIAFRYGGDEFAAIIVHADSSKAQAIVDRINSLVTTSLRKTTDRSAARLSISAGIACFPNDAKSADDLVRIADAAMYDAKRAARPHDVRTRREADRPLVPAAVSRRAEAERPAGASSKGKEKEHALPGE